MKRFYLLLTLCFSLLTIAAAQMTKKVDETFPIPSTRKIDANLKFARTIAVTSWDRNEIGLKKTIRYSDEKLLAMDEQTVEEKGGVLTITTGYKMEDREGKKSKYQCWSCDTENNNDGECICFQVSYELLLPAGMELELATIAGDISLSDYRGGEVELNSISGGIEIKNAVGRIKARSISGFVDFTSSPSKAMDLAFKSVTGEIYTDFDLTLDEGSTSFSKRLNRSLNGGGERVALETVSGDIYLRKEN